jgi:preprotein translocase subunit SecB
LTEEQQLFLNWFEECGFPTLQSVLSKELPNDPDLVAQIEYEHYILSEELDYGSPEDIRAALVNIIVDLPTRIESAATASETIYELYEYTADYVGIFSEVFYNPTSVFSSMPNKDIIEDTLPIRQGFLLSEGICSTDVECLKQFLMMGGIHNLMKYEEYELIRSKVQLTNACLHELSVKRLSGNDNRLNLRVFYSHDNHNGNNLDIFMKVEINFIDVGPFELSCVYKGELKSSEDLEKDEFIKFAEIHTVPFLLPYVRECVSSTLAQMQLPTYTLPTIDILNSMSSNNDEDEG